MIVIHVCLQEKWYTRNSEPQSDPRASLILSGLSLGFSLIANALLVIRFSLQGARWRIATRVSVACWVVKVSLIYWIRFMHYEVVRV